MALGKTSEEHYMPDYTRGVDLRPQPIAGVRYDPADTLLSAIDRHLKAAGAHPLLLERFEGKAEVKWLDPEELFFGAEVRPIPGDRTDSHAVMVVGVIPSADQALSDCRRVVVGHRIYGSAQNMHPIAASPELAFAVNSMAAYREMVAGIMRPEIYQPLGLHSH